MNKLSLDIYEGTFEYRQAEITISANQDILYEITENDVLYVCGRASILSLGIIEELKLALHKKSKALTSGSTHSNVETEAVESLIKLIHAVITDLFVAEFNLTNGTTTTR